MKKQKVCLIGQFPPPIHGLSKALDTLLKSESETHFVFEPVNITNNKRFFKNLRRIRKSDANLFYLTISQTRFGNLRDLIIAKAIKKKKRSLVVHLHGGGFSQLFQTLPSWQKRANHKWLFSNVATGIVLGDSLKDQFSGVLPAERIVSIPNCVDNDMLMSNASFADKVKSWKQRDVKHVLYLSNFIKEKGYPFVLELACVEQAAIASGKSQRFVFDFAGAFLEKSERDFFFGFIEERHLEPLVKYHGVVSGTEKANLLAGADFFVLPTHYPKEGQPISILEAMGNGAIVVTTGHAGIPDLVNEKNGIVIGEDSAETIYDKMAAADFAVCSKNRSLVLNEFSQARYIENLDRVFMGALNGLNH